MKINPFSIAVAAGLLICFVLCVYPKDGAPVSRPAVAPVVSAAPDAPAGPRKISIPEAAILGVVEGLTEYLPVSSTGHLILANNAMGMTRYSEERGPMGRKIEKNDALDSFDVVIQLGAILAVVGLYRRRVRQMAVGIKAGTSAWIAQKGLGTLDEDHREGLHLFTLLMIAFLPAAVVGKLFHQQIEDNLFGPVPVMYALAVGGVLMIVVERFFYRKSDRPRQTIDQMMYWQALVIGLAQCLAMWPGTSRSMITMIAAMVIGLDIVAAAEFSFLLALPTLGAATLYSGFKHHHELFQSAGVGGLLVGLIVSGIVAAIAVKGFVKWLTRHGLMPFGVYRILLAAVLLWYFSNLR